jgi:parallel beta helix pectate lyase-like protein
MSKQTNPRSGAYLTPRAFYVLGLLLAVCTVPFMLAQQTGSKQIMTRVHGASIGLVRLGNALPANTIVVTNTNDSGTGSLRDALAVANDGDTIDATGVSGTIFLTSGELQIHHNVTINGPGAGNLAVNGNAASRVFENFASDVTISGFTITNGSVTNGGGGGIFSDGGNSATLTLSNCTVSGNSAEFGGGIVNSNGTLTVSNCTISNNGGIFGGGGISNSSGTMTLTNSTIIGNLAGGDGGGISNHGFRVSATLMVTNCIVRGNTAALSRGGGISNSADEGSASLTIANSTISGNSADFGGGICNTGGAQLAGEMVNVSNSTISGNSASNGGGIGNAAPVGDTSGVTVTNSTLSGNSATGNGGGICNNSGGGSTTLELSNVILNTGSSGENIFNNGGTVTSHGYNLSSDDGGGVLTGPGDQINTDPVLGPLQGNGGPTFTHALLPGSPAINTGDPSFTPPPFFDQRGSPFHRVVSGRIDIGSFEVQATRTSPPRRPRPTPAPRP